VHIGQQKLNLRRKKKAVRWPGIRYDTRCYFNVRSKADISQLNLPHGRPAGNSGSHTKLLRQWWRAGRIAAYCPLLSHFEYINHWAVPDMSKCFPLNIFLFVQVLRVPLNIHGSLGQQTPQIRSWTLLLFILLLSCLSLLFYLLPFHTYIQCML